MGFKNYTTKISVEKTIMEIEQILSKHGVTDIWKQYDGAGNIMGVNFIVDGEFGKMPFRLPMNAQAVSQCIKNERAAGRAKGIPKRLAEDIEHARRVGWRIIKDWIDAQLAIVDMELVKVEQVFLPYAYDYSSDSTLYEKLKEKKFAGMLMEGQPQDRI